MSREKQKSQKQSIYLTKEKDLEQIGVRVIAFTQKALTERNQKTDKKGPKTFQKFKKGLCINYY